MPRSVCEVISAAGVRATETNRVLPYRRPALFSKADRALRLAEEYPPLTGFARSDGAGVLLHDLGTP